MKYYINNCFFVRVTNESIEKRDMLEKMYKGEISIKENYSTIFSKKYY